MSWSYSGNPADSKLNEIRFQIGDTNQDEPIMQDEEIEFLIDTYGSNDNQLLYQVFNRAATLFARDIKRKLGPQSEDPTSRLKYFNSQAEYYKNKGVSLGMSIPNYKHSKVFRVGMQNNPPVTGDDDV